MEVSLHVATYSQTWLTFSIKHWKTVMAWAMAALTLNTTSLSNTGLTPAGWRMKYSSYDSVLSYNYYNVDKQLTYFDLWDPE